MTLFCIFCKHQNPMDSCFCEQCGQQISPEETGNTLPQQLPLQYCHNQKDVISIGSDNKNKLILPFPQVSPFHAKALVKNGCWRIEDINSAHGLFLNSKQNKIQWAPFSAKDTVYFGALPIPGRRIIRAADEWHNYPSKKIPLRKGRMIVGSGDGSDIYCNHSSVINQHLVLNFDKTSTATPSKEAQNNTTLNGKLLSTSSVIKPCDILTAGRLVLKIHSHYIELINTWDPKSIEADNLSYVVGTKLRTQTILDRVSFTIEPGELVGLMGPAGCGKSTLIKILTGQILPISGSVKINNTSIHANPEIFRTSFGYVPQEHIFHKDLSVEQILRYAGRLRLENVNTDELEKRIKWILEKLGLFAANANIRKVRAGDISGGQKRRLSIALELLTDPRILFLDEPTSGLSSEDALQLLQLLRSMANEGRTIFLIIHQPGITLLKLLDNLLLMKVGGRVAYYGPAFPDAGAFTSSDPRMDSQNADDILVGLARKPAAHWQKAYKDSIYYHNYTKERGKKTAMLPPLDGDGENRTFSSLKQWLVLHSRNLHNRIQDKTNGLVLLLQAPIIALLIAMVFMPKTQEESYLNVATVHYLAILASVWFGCSNAARDICGEWAIYKRERMYNLKLLPYLGSKLSVGMIISAVQCLIFTAIISNICRTHIPFLVFLGITWIISLTGTMIGICVSAFAAPFKKNNEIALALIPIILLPMVILAGFIQPLKNMKPGVRILTGFIPTRWAYESIIVSEARATPGSVDSTTFRGKTISTKKEDIILQRFFEKDQKHTPLLAALIPILLGLLAMVLAFALLEKADAPTQFGKH